MANKQVALIVLDGWGYRKKNKDNAIAQANKPIFDSLLKKYPHSTLKASGLSVGLPRKQMGNSEVGHMTIGAGRILKKDLVRINKAISSGEFKKNPNLIKLFNYVKNNNSTLHVAGLLSSGGIHSHILHLFEFLKIAKKFGIKKIAVHIFTDGRDTAPQSGAGYLKKLEKFLKKLGVGEISSVSGRLYAMDRDNRWERLAMTEKVMFYGKGTICNIKPSEFLEGLYKENKVDEKIKPFVCLKRDGSSYSFKNGDGIFLFNFRADRMRMLTQKIMELSKEKNLCLVTMTNYESKYHNWVIFPKIKVSNTLGKIISDNEMTQARIAETEKFAHATYFLDCGEENPYKGEEQFLIQSPKDVLTYDLKPKMSAKLVADRAIEQIENGIDFIFINFANADMVGHTANIPAIITAIEEVDKQLGRVIESLNKKNSIALVTADHGNAEINIDSKTKLPHTAHTRSLVPLIITNVIGSLKKGGLSDIAPTILNLFGLKKPEEMTGRNLLEK